MEALLILCLFKCHFDGRRVFNHRYTVSEIDIHTIIGYEHSCPKREQFYPKRYLFIFLFLMLFLLSLALIKVLVYFFEAKILTATIV